MIIAEFSKFLQLHNEELLLHKTSPLELLPVWVKIISSNPARNNYEKIVHKELLFCENDTQDCIIIGKSESGRVLLKSLISFAKSYDNYTQAKWKEITEQSYRNN